MKRNKKGFTLIEILIVLVVLAALAGLAIPGYINTVEKSRKQEALVALAAAKDSLERASSLTNDYPIIREGTDFSQLDFDPNAQASAASRRHFNYSIGSTNTTFTVTALRNSVDFPLFGANPYQVQINQLGTITVAETTGTPPASTQT